MARATEAARDSREQILDAAAGLFYAQGVRAVTVDAVVAAAGLSKMTLYRYFKSKDELVAAYLVRRDERSSRRFIERTLELGATPREQLVVMFDVLAEWFDELDFRGCAFLNTSAEYPDVDHPVRSMIRTHKSGMRRFISDRVEQAGRGANAELAEALFLLMEGATVTAQWEDSSRAARAGRWAAGALLRAVDVQQP